MAGREISIEAANAALESGARVVSVPVLAALLDSSVSGMYDAVANGKAPIEPIRIGRAIRFRVSDVRALLGMTG